MLQKLRVQEALRQADGRLQAIQDRGDFLWIDWVSAQGQQHTSAITKDDLSVISAGICLSGMDSNFDLQSLVGVVDGDTG